MIGIDAVPVVRPYGQAESLDRPLPEEFGEFDSEFFVEWQVADRALLVPASGEVNSL